MACNLRVTFNIDEEGQISVEKPGIFGNSKLEFSVEYSEERDAYIVLAILGSGCVNQAPISDLRKDDNE